jgi:NodT family efflux transporter outer membrane factor (OMF) lipoprotein
LAAGRSSFSFGGPAFLRTQYSAGLQSSWELDLFGGLARQQEANLSQLASRTASWHDARVSVAVELANAYVNYRYCEIQSQQLLADTLSRKTTADYTRISSEQGFLSGNDLALALASNSDGQKALSFQQGQCQRFIKGLVQLTGLEENAITLAISAHPEQQTKLPTPPAFNLRSLPAQVISQRPDIAAAERDMAEASANIGVEQAKRYPKLSLSGNITPTLQSMNSSALALAQTWSIGPTLNLPLFDGGKKAANVESAKAQYELAATRYQTKVRTAIKEVEESLVRLDTAKQRLPLAQQSAEHYQQVFSANQILFNNGLINGLELETARRNQLSAELAIKEMEQERISAWIALYRAVGGGWQASESATNSDSSSNTPSNQAHSIAGQS